MIEWDENGNLYDHGRKLMHPRDIAPARLPWAGRRERGLARAGVDSYLLLVKSDYERLVTGVFAYADENERFRQQLRQPDGPGPHVNDAAHRLARNVLRDSQEKANQQVRDASATAAGIIGRARALRRTIIGQAEAEAEQKGRDAAERERGTLFAVPGAGGPQTAGDLAREVAALREANAGLREKNAYLGAYSDSLRSHIRTKAESTLRDLDQWEHAVTATITPWHHPAPPAPGIADAELAAAPVSASQPAPGNPAGRTPT